MRDIQFPGRSPVMGTHGMVATSHPLSTQAGLRVLQEGGNAMDAAVAACAVQCVVEPQSTGIGGDCFLLFHEASTGRLHGYNGSGRAPGKATLETYRKLGHRAVPERGILSVTVPGTIEAWETCLRRFGTMELERVLAPAIAFAEEGFPVTPVVSIFWKRNEALLASTRDARETLLVDGSAPTLGSRFRNPNLARSLRLIAQQGASAFYTGALAEKIVRFSQENGGLLELDDFAAHRGDWVEPISTDYRGLSLFEIPPNGQGITALMTLNILENLPLGDLERLGPEHTHLMIEAYKLAVTERDRFVSDPEVNNIPVEALLSKDFAKSQLARINPAKAAGYPLSSGLPEHKDTVYLTVADQDGNLVSFINSLFKNFGSGMVAGDTGIALQNRGFGFVLEEGHFNCIAPRKRPMHTIIPPMVYRGGQPVLSFGVMGGLYQPMGHAYVLTNWLDFGLDIQEAIDAPRFLPGKGVLSVERGFPHATREALTRRGHKIEEEGFISWGAQAIYVDSEAGVFHGASDPRKDGCALGY